MLFWVGEKHKYLLIPQFLSIIDTILNLNASTLHASACAPVLINSVLRLMYSTSSNFDIACCALCKNRLGVWPRKAAISHVVIWYSREKEKKSPSSISIEPSTSRRRKTRQEFLCPPEPLILKPKIILIASRKRIQLIWNYFDEIQTDLYADKFKAIIIKKGTVRGMDSHERERELRICWLRAIQAEIEIKVAI